MMPSKNIANLETISLFCISVIVFTSGLASQEITGFDSRFYLFALETWRHGASWFPTTYHTPYPDYPATSTYLIYLVSLLIGHLNKFTAVLPSAVMAAITLTMTYCIGRLHNKYWGIYAVCFLLTTITFLKSARTISLDLYSCMLTTCCFYIIQAAAIQKTPKKIGYIYPLFALGFLFRGPIGLVIPTGVVCAYYLLECNFKRLLQVGLLSLLLLSIGTTLLIVLALHSGGYAFMHDVIRMEVLGRMSNSNLPIYFYLTSSLANYALSFPLALVSTLGICYYSYHQRNLHDMKFISKLLAWVLIILIGMSIPGEKKTRYVLPMIPAIALIAAYPFTFPCKENCFLFLRKTIIKLFYLFPMIFIIATLIANYYCQQQQWQLSLHTLAITILLSFTQALLFYIYRTKTHHPEALILPLASLSFVLFYLFIIEPMELYIDKTRDFVVNIEAQRKSHHAHLIFYKEHPDGTPIKYLINMPQEEEPRFIDNQKDIIKDAAPAFYITSTTYYAKLPPDITRDLKIIKMGKLGHNPVVVFTRKLRSFAE
ncbi:MAG: hypothetical protein A3E83_00710 [Gammaproteobacteria bacterium RIFCSPHIGHO2_12_FULL_41_20]|nr:MAG: hypothetical protein A3E83_00710 [Gammaproteobacteria bacterium RIFCSPHIGHO2_12_FULL_41_20]